ncbi:TetR/AcrR family transcriptional regulator [Sphingobium sp.]|uniref:TetR/AcrR family transcriptional regulator n=1 Tax=Sphingobium sp. TaxID=1912891 RepID=UPI003BB54E71
MDSIFATGQKSASGRSRAARGSITKPRILGVSATLFQERGYDRTSLDDIAGKLKITKPSLYYHFRSKEDILLECIRAGYLHFQDRLLRSDDPAASGRERTKILLRTYHDVLVHDLGLSLIVADDRVMSEDTKKEYDKYRRAMNEELESRIKLGIQDGSIISPESRITAYAIFGMFNAMTLWRLRTDVADSSDILERMFSIIFEGIGG